MKARSSKTAVTLNPFLFHRAMVYQIASLGRQKTAGHFTGIASVTGEFNAVWAFPGPAVAKHFKIVCTCSMCLPVSRDLGSHLEGILVIFHAICTAILKLR